MGYLYNAHPYHAAWCVLNSLHSGFCQDTGSRFAGGDCYTEDLNQAEEAKALGAIVYVTL